MAIKAFACYESFNLSRIGILGHTFAGNVNFIYSLFIHFACFVCVLNALCITTNQLEHIPTNLSIHLSYLEDQRNLKIYNKNIRKQSVCVCALPYIFRQP